jgi:hypothetical protein
VQIPLLIPIPAEPVLPIGFPNVVPSVLDMQRCGHYTLVYKGLKDSFDKATKIHKEANESAEKARNDYASVHAPNSRVITAHREIHRSRKAEAVRIVADLGRLGQTYEAAMVLIGVNAPGNAALIAQLQPICNLYPAIIARSTNMAILWECQDYVEHNFAPGQPSQHSYFRTKIEKLRDKDVPEGMNEVSRLFTTYLNYLQMAGGALPEKTIEDYLDAVLTHSNWRDWVDQMHMETLRQTPTVDRLHTWPLVLRDIRLKVEGDPSKDSFRFQSNKRTATQAGYSSWEDSTDDQSRRKKLRVQTDHTAGRGGRISQAPGNPGKQPSWDRKKKEEAKYPRNVTFEGANETERSHYQPQAAGWNDGREKHCNRCWGTDHWWRDCTAERCKKCTAPIKGGVYHDATTCTPRVSNGGRGRGDGRGRRGGRGGRGGRGN